MFAGVNGFIDKVPKDKLTDWEQKLYDYGDNNAFAKEALVELGQKKELSSDITEKLKRILGEFNQFYGVG